MSVSLKPWWKTATVYQIYPASFKDSDGDGVGDLPGIISKLDYIESLGVDAIWICPIYDSPQYDSGYDVSDYESIYPPYGTISDVERLIYACHERGLRILLDLVVNHTSHLHAWFQDSRSSKTSDKRNWYIWKPAQYDEQGNRRPPNNWRSAFGGSVWEWDEATQEYYLHFFSREQPDLNWDNPDTRAGIYRSAMEFWLRKGIDGFRVDTANMYSKAPEFANAPIVDQSQEWQSAVHFFCNGPHIHEYLREMGAILKNYGAIAVGELPNTPEAADVLSYVSAERGELNMVFQFDLINIGVGEDFRFNTTPRNWTLKDLQLAVQRTQALMDGTDGWCTTFLENHDIARSISRFGCDDTVEQWERSGKLLAMFTTTLSGTLYLYQGQEIGMVNAPSVWSIDEYRDIESINYYEHVRKTTSDNPASLAAAMSALGHLARDHARLPMQWDFTVTAGFAADGTMPWMRVHDNYPGVNVKKQTPDPNSLLSFWKGMLRVRKEHVHILAHGVVQLLNTDHPSILTYEKIVAGEQLLVILNFTGTPHPVDIGTLLYRGKRETLAKNYNEEPLDILRPWEGRVYLTNEAKGNILCE